ncbi:MAG: hypothetical protein K1X57_04050 [Gemmataceae bacterium]|nr:hypothetical protein [Gemmataceae bacterium]
MSFNLIEDAGRLGQGALAVIGGAVIGAVVTGFMTNSAVRLVTTRQIPPLILRWVRLFAGFAGGLMVGYVVFSGIGGWGLGGAGGNNTGELPPAGTAAADTKSLPPAAPVGITLLGGPRVRGAAFYQLDRDQAAKSLGELGTGLPAKPGTFALRIYDDSVARDHVAVTELVAWAERLGWKVIIEEFKGQTLPPETKRP